MFFSGTYQATVKTGPEVARELIHPVERRQQGGQEVPWGAIDGAIGFW
jgi:hypothetical protein